MTIRGKFLKHASAVTLLMWIGAGMITPLVYADDTAPGNTPTPEPAADTPAPTINTPEPTNTPPPEETTTPAPTEPVTPTDTPIPTETGVLTPTPDPLPAADPTITTGDATASATGDTTINTNQQTVPGETGGNTDCGVTGNSTCSADINNDNAATASADVGSEAGTGNNQVATSAGDTKISSGNATSSGENSSQINTNEVILASTPTPTPEGQTDSGQPKSNSLTVVINNTADVASNTNVTSITGKNTDITGSGASTINTGNADAIANVLNVINTNAVGSDIQTFSLNITCHDTQDVDLSALWKKILTVDENGNVELNPNISSNPNLTITLVNNNSASVTNHVNVGAGTGNNNASGSAGTISTGDALAAANVTNIVNTNILGSKIFIGNINILADQNINLIFPRPELFSADSGALIFKIPLTAVNNNTALVNNTVKASANSGDNAASGGGSIMITGKARALVNSTTIANSNIIGNNWLFLIFNNTGGWSGKILNWKGAGSSQTPASGTTILQAGINPNSSDSQGTGEPDLSAPGVTLQNQNLAQVSNVINVTANTGNNSATSLHGGNGIITGDARAIANLFSLVNLNLVGSNWFFDNVNILGKWSGNAIFAYPDVGIGLSADRENVQPGDVVNYYLHYENKGYDRASGVRVNLVVPPEMVPVSQDGNCSLTSCNWNVGSLDTGRSGDIMVPLKVKDDFNFNKQATLWGVFIPRAMADAGRLSREIPVEAYISMTEPDPNTGNNSAALSEVVWEKLDSSGSDQRQPEISITAHNNVNGYVYPGDTVTFEIDITNNADALMNNARLEQKIFGNSGNYLGSMSLSLGTIEAHKTGKLTFGLAVPQGAAAGAYRTQAVITGQAPDGNGVSSNSADTQFGVRLKLVYNQAQSGIWTIADTYKGEVLGASTAHGPWCTDRNQDIWIFVMLFLTSTVLFANRLEEKLNPVYAKKV